MHLALDKLAFFAVTGSLETLEKLIDLLKQENDHWQKEFDEGSRVLTTPDESP